jgi:hypothetical protein
MIVELDTGNGERADEDEREDEPAGDGQAT